jgi:hypothetical protein
MAGAEEETQEFTLVAQVGNSVTSAALPVTVLLVHGEVQLPYVTMQGATRMKFKLHQIEKAQERHVILITKTFVAKRQVGISTSAIFLFTDILPSLRFSFRFM